MKLDADLFTIVLFIAKYPGVTQAQMLATIRNTQKMFGQPGPDGTFPNKLAAALRDLVDANVVTATYQDDGPHYTVTEDQFRLARMNETGALAKVVRDYRLVPYPTA